MSAYRVRGTVDRRTFIKHSSAAMGALTVGGFLQSCGSSNEPPSRSRGGGGTLRFGVGEPTTSADFDDAKVAGGTDYLVAGLVQDRLLEFDKDGRTIVPRLATGYRYVNPRTLEVDLRSGVTYHNGDTFSANDVKAALERVSTDETLGQNALWASVEVKVLSPMKVEIVTETPFAPLINVLAMTSIPPERFVRNPKLFVNNDVGAGAYKFVEYKRNSILLEANDRYWDGRPAIDQIIIDYIENSDARFNGLLSGEIHIMRGAGPQQVEAIQEQDEFRVLPDLPSSWGLLTQQKKPELQDPRVRQALIYAVNREGLVDQLYGVGGFDRFAPVSDSILIHDIPFYEPLSQRFPHDPDRAKALLDEAGVGQLRLSFLGSAGLVPLQSQLLEGVVQNLRDVGIQVDVTVEETGKARTDFTKFDLSFNGIGAIARDPDYMLNIYTGSLGPAIFAYPENSEILRQGAPLVAKQRSAIDENERQPAVTEAAEFLWNLQPLLPICDLAPPQIASTRVKNYFTNQTHSVPLLRNAELTA